MYQYSTGVCVIINSLYEILFPSKSLFKQYYLHFKRKWNVFQVLLSYKYVHI